MEGYCAGDAVCVECVQEVGREHLPCQLVIGRNTCLVSW